MGTYAKQEYVGLLHATNTQFIVAVTSTIIQVSSRRSLPDGKTKWGDFWPVNNECTTSRRPVTRALSRVKRVISERRARKSRGDEGGVSGVRFSRSSVPSVFSRAHRISYTPLYIMFVYSKRDYTEGYLWSFASISVSLGKLNVK